MKEGAERKACEVILSFEARIGGCVTLLIADTQAIIIALVHRRCKFV